MVSLAVPSEAKGWLRLMPAGPAPRQAYWTALKQLGQRLRFDDPSGQGLMALLDLQARIADELKPDYLLIDARTGVTELGGLATTILADTVVCMFVPNQESLDGTLTVVEALRASPRLASQQPIRIVPVLARAVAEPVDDARFAEANKRLAGPGLPQPPSIPRDERFAEGIKRLVELGVGKRKGNTEEVTVFSLPQDDIFGTAERLVGGERRASTFSPLYAAYLDLFQTLFPSNVDESRDVLKRLLAVAGIQHELTSEGWGTRRLEGLFPPWAAADIREGVRYVSERNRRESRYADLICQREGRAVIAVEYVGEGDIPSALQFWSEDTPVRCVVLLIQDQVVYRKIFTRGPDARDLHAAEGRELPRPREFDLLPDVGDQSADAMVEALHRGHAEAAAWLVAEWRDCALGFPVSGLPRLAGRWRPERAQRILDGLAATEDPRCAEEVLRFANPGGYWRRRRWRSLKDQSVLTEEPDRWMARDLFAPLFWRLPVEAVLKAMRPQPERFQPGLPLAGYRLLAEDLMGLRYDPDGATLEQIRTLMDSDRHSEENQGLGWLHGSRTARLERVQFSNDLPPLLVWEDVLRNEPYWHGALLQAREKAEQALKGGGLHSRVKRLAARNGLNTHGLLGDYGGPDRIELYGPLIAAAAEVLKISPRYLKSIVFIQLSAWSLAHESHDLDGEIGYGFAPSARTSPLSTESPAHVAIVQAFVDRLIQKLKDPNLEAAFEKLSKHQPEHYQQWASMRKLPLEGLRTLLLRARASSSAIGLPEPGNSK
jgi:hypothetical protein